MTDYTNIDYAPLFRAYDKETIVKAVVGDISGKGHQVFVLGFPAFLPSTQVNPEDDVETGREVDVCVIKIMPETNNVIVSARVAAEKKVSLDAYNLEVGTIVTAKIKNLTKFGAFASIGKVDGLIHITELSYSRINDPSEVVSVGQEIPVKIINISEEDENGRRKIELSYKQTLPDPWNSLSINVGDVVSCTVSRIMEFGLMVIVDGVNAIVHRSELSWDTKSPEPNTVAKLGDSMKVKILSIDHDNRKIYASLREIDGDPMLMINVGDLVNAIVVKKLNFGFILKGDNGIEGLLHNNDLAWSKVEKDAQRESLDIGDTIRVVVAEINNEKRKLSFSLKSVEENLNSD